MEQTTPIAGTAEPPGTISSKGPRPLPYCAYPKASNVANHGVQPLPASLPLVDFGRSRPHRSSQYTTVVAADLTPDQVLQMARVVAASFARCGPESRSLQPPKYPPAGLMETSHTDPFGSDSFGPWKTETFLYWLIRLFLLTDPTSPQSAIRVNEEVLTQSFAILNRREQVIGGAFNETMPPFDKAPSSVRTTPL
jgi:hypothetical protein